MPRYRLKAAVSWIAGSETELGLAEAENEDAAAEQAFEAACDRLEAWAEEIEDSPPEPTK